MAATRTASVERKTTETEVQLELGLDGSGRYEVDTGVPFFDHMLELFAKHSGVDLRLKARGDIEVDFHHTVEDTGLCLGEALRKAIGEGGGIQRYGQSLVPMQEALCQAALDICGRGFLVYHAEGLGHKVGQFDVELTRDFFQALASNAKVTLHINLLYGENQHHMVEAMFKAVARALREAVRVVGSPEEVPSTKGIL
ncbi:MAG TPA: imidazoleglycerol-phosphate dehydratase HisB [Firmicutes bacterium]|nr:imidazoleglycerol-phosphate dehydratase HisB [Bacillota bacterium]